jgi:hypothetical protein
MRWGNARVADNPTALSLFREYGPERNKFLAFLTQNYIDCWARRMVGRTDLVVVPGSVWNSGGHLMFAPKQGESGGINQTYIRDGERRDIFHDVHLNLAQMKRVWPNIELTEAREDIR